MTTVTAPRDTTYQQIARDQAPATPAQRSFIERLVAERATAGTPYEGWTPDWSRATRKTASQVIDYLSGLPKVERPRREFGASWSSIPVGTAGYGYYALEVADGVTKFFRVERPIEGRHAGKTFIQEQASDAFYPIEPRGRGYSYLTQIAADHEAAGRLYGREIGRCCRCNRTLTDESSRAAGIGPDCAKRG